MHPRSASELHRLPAATLALWRLCEYKQALLLTAKLFCDVTQLTDTQVTDVLGQRVGPVFKGLLDT